MLKKPDTQKASTGQSLTEYGLIIALAALLAIPALIMFGGSIQTTLAGMYPNSAPATAGLTSPPGSTNSGSAGTTSGSTTGSESVTLANGSVITLPSELNNLRNSVATSGANGATNVLASSIEAVAKQMLDAGKLTQEQHNALIALANQGHKIAGIEKQYEAAAASSTSSADYANAILPLHGGQAPAPTNSPMGYTPTLRIPPW